MEENKKGAFLSKVEDFAKEMSEMTSDKETKRGLVILATETPKDSDTTANEIAIMGNGGQVIRAIAELASREQTRHLIVEGLKLASLKNLIDKLGGDLTTISLTIKSSNNERITSKRQQCGGCFTTNPSRVQLL